MDDQNSCEYSVFDRCYKYRHLVDDPSKLPICDHKKDKSKCNTRLISGNSSLDDHVKMNQILCIV